MKKLVSIAKFKYNNTIYACISNCYADCLKLANKIAPCQNREFLGSYIQGNSNCETFYKFLQNTNVVIRQEN